MFLTRFDPELVGITTMSVRACYASMMVSKFRKNKIFRGMSESDFISYLSKVMNTSPEQILETYSHCDLDGFTTSANRFVAVMDESDLEGMMRPPATCVT